MWGGMAEEFAGFLFLLAFSARNIQQGMAGYVEGGYLKRVRAASGSLVWRYRVRATSTTSKASSRSPSWMSL